MKRKTEKEEALESHVSVQRNYGIGDIRVRAQRLSKVNFDKLLMAHQDSPLLEGAREAVEKLVAEYIRNLKRQKFEPL
jgi:hypothetical protein